MFSRLGRDKWIIRCSNKSGDIYLSLFLTYIVFVKRTIMLVLHIFICRTIIRHNIGVTPCIWSAHWRHYILAFDHSALLNGRVQTACGPVYINTRPVLRLRRFTIPAGGSPSAPVYNSRGRLSHPRRPTMPAWPILLFVAGYRPTLAHISTNQSHACSYKLSNGCVQAVDLWSGLF